jgi:hypothetical protein
MPQAEQLRQEKILLVSLLGESVRSEYSMKQKFQECVSTVNLIAIFSRY